MYISLSLYIYIYIYIYILMPTRFAICQTWITFEHSAPTTLLYVCVYIYIYIHICIGSIGYSFYRLYRAIVYIYWLFIYSTYIHSMYTYTYIYIYICRGKPRLRDPSDVNTHGFQDKHVRPIQLVFHPSPLFFDAPVQGIPPKMALPMEEQAAQRERRA